MDIAVYGGSFNPLHIGHLAILRHLAERFDKVLLVVSPKNPLKDIESDGTERLDAAVAAVGRHPELEGKVEVCDIEYHLPLPSYTYRTLDALNAGNYWKEEPDSFTLVMGGDQIADIRRWREYQHILKDYGVAVFPREGFDLEAIKADLLEEDPDYSIELMDAPLVTVSSTEIREGVASGKDISGLLM